jgi:hypothetical protein
MLRRVLISIGWTALTVVVVGLTFALVAYGNDYAYDFQTHRIIQKGHVIISSLPSGINVTADGKQLHKRTPYQSAYKVGTHTFELAKEGFVTWKKTIQVVAGQVSLAKYVILVPNKPQQTTLDTHPGIVAQAISKDHRHLAYIASSPDGWGLYTLDLGNAKPVKLYTPKAATPTAPAEVLRDVSWSDDASHLLIVSSVGPQTVHRLAAAGGGEPVNLTDQYKFDFTGIRFSGGNWRQLYWISPDGLRRLDVDAQTVSAVLADKVSQFWVTPDRVLYVQQTDLGRSLWSLDRSLHHQELIQALAESDSYAVSYAQFRGEDELTVVPAKTGVGTLYSGIFGDTPVAKTVAKGVNGAYFAPDGHLAAFTGSNSIVTYDLEQSTLNSRYVAYQIAGQDGLAALTWFDNFHLLTTRGGHIYWSEFDGANAVDLGVSAGVLPAYGSGDLKNVVYFQPAGADVRVDQLAIKP